MTDILLTEYQYILAQQALQADMPAKCNTMQRCLAHASLHVWQAKCDRMWYVLHLSKCDWMWVLWHMYVNKATCNDWGGLWLGTAEPKIIYH